MNLNKERLAGAKAARSAKAKRTLKILKNGNGDFEKILHSAVDEAGLDALVTYCLQGTPKLAYETLRHISDLGPYRNELIQKAAESPEMAALTLRNIPNLGNNQDLLRKNSTEFATTMGEISGFNLYNQGGYIAYFTMYWVDNGIQYPIKDAKKTWSGKILLGQNETKSCNYFPTEKEPLVTGNEVWMYLYVQAGCDVETPFRFTYNPNSAKLAYFTCAGTTTGATLSLTKVAAPASAVLS